MSDPDRLDEIRTRREAMPSEPLDIHVTPTEEEYYRQWRIIEYGQPDEYGERQRVAFLGEEDEGAAEFIANAPADIDWLVGEITWLCDLLARLEWAGRKRSSPDRNCPACHGWPANGHDPGCELAAALAGNDV